jgi:hypothetical protein
VFLGRAVTFVRKASMFAWAHRILLLAVLDDADDLAVDLDDERLLVLDELLLDLPVLEVPPIGSRRPVRARSSRGELRPRVRRDASELGDQLAPRLA